MEVWVLPLLLLAQIQKLEHLPDSQRLSTLSRPPQTSILGLRDTVKDQQYLVLSNQFFVFKVFLLLFKAL